MQNNQDTLCIEFICLCLANSQNSTHYITEVFWLHFLMQNNHDLSCIEFVSLYLANSPVADPGGVRGVKSNPPLAHSLVWKIPIWTFTFAQKYLSGNLRTPPRTPLHRILDPPQQSIPNVLYHHGYFASFFWRKIRTISYASNSCAYTWPLLKVRHFISRYVVISLHFLMHNNHDLLCIKFLCLYLANTQNSTYYITVVIWLHLLMQNNHDLLCIKSACLYLANSQNLTHYVIMVIWPHFLCEITTICYASNSCAYTWLTVKIQLIISPWLFKRLCM